MPLSGIRVLDFGRYIAGPYCAALLGDYGADVIRIEAPDGNDDRFNMPVAGDGSGSIFLQMNRNKRCLTLKPNDDAGREIIRRLVQSADIIVANMPDDVLEKLGLDYPSLAAQNPRIILASASSFGSAGPMAKHVGYDAVGQAMSGAMYISGDEDRPARVQVNYVDFGTALHLAFGVMAALRTRESTGKGQHVSATLLGTALAYTNHLTIEHAVTGIERRPAGSRGFSSAPTDVFRASDGWVMTQIAGSAIFARWAKLMGQPNLPDDPRFSSDVERGKNSALLSEIMQNWCNGKSQAQIISAFAEARLPAAPVLKPCEALAQPQVAAMGLVEAVDYPETSASIPIIRSPIHLSDSAKQAHQRAPILGEHRDEILAELGYDKEEIAKLVAQAIV